MTQFSLSNFGVMTELDGSLSIDTIKFAEYFKKLQPILRL